MRSDFINAILAVAAVVVAAAAQELSPSFCGVKPPFLLMLSLFMAVQPKKRFLRLATALAAGAMAEALSMMPTGSLVAFFVAVAILARVLRATGAQWFVVALAPAACEAWLAAWGVPRSLPVAVPVSLLLTGFAAECVFWAVPAAWRFAGVDPETQRPERRRP